MPEITVFAVFIPAALLLLVTPGPAVLFVIARSIEHGTKAGIVSAFGLTAGGLVHVMAAVIGLSALIAQSALAFNVVKYLGAAYLVYLGIRAFRDAPDSHTVKPPRARKSSNLFFEGFMVNVLNPKAALFFLAFLPQFVDPSTGNPGMQAFVLGLTLVALGVVTDIAYVLLASGTGRMLNPAPGTRTGLKRLSGATYLGLGLYAALSDGSRHR